MLFSGVSGVSDVSGASGVSGSNSLGRMCHVRFLFNPGLPCGSAGSESVVP